MEKIINRINLKMIETKIKLSNIMMNEDGSSTLEILIITAVLVAVALIFRKELMEFVNNVVSKVFGVQSNVVDGL